MGNSKVSIPFFISVSESPNILQTEIAANALYLLNSPGFNVQLRRDGFSYDLYTASGHRPQASTNNLKPEACSLKPESCSIRYHRIDITLEGSNPDCQIIATNPLPDYFNYYTDYAPDAGINYVRQFRNVKYNNIYPGIDLEFFANTEHGYKYNFVVHQGANINDIHLKIAGPSCMFFSPDTIKFMTSLGDVEEMIPVSYYLANNSGVPVKAMFRKLNNEVYCFSIDQVIPSNSTLIIDPYVTRVWGTYYGGSLNDLNEGTLAVDKFRNVIIGGWTASTNNMATSGAYQTTLAGSTDGFVAKMTPDGQRGWGT